jgi:L-2-hydroxyglutarate oxidase LhgO
VFSRLIYPAPIHGGLGVHVTLDLAGRMRFGPDVEWTEEDNYDVDPKRADVFYASIRKYFPRLKDGTLVPDYAGIRPKLTGPTEAAVDFMIDGPKQHGVPRLVNLFGIESPGLTSSLSIAEEVVEALDLALTRTTSAGAAAAAFARPACVWPCWRRLRRWCPAA